MEPEQQDRQWQQARRHLQENRIDAGKQLLQVLANQNFAPAQCDLATVLLMGAVDAYTAQQALDLYRQAERQHYPDASYQLACISLNDTLEPLDWQRLSERLAVCCTAFNANALCDAAVFLAQFGTPEQQTMSTGLLELSALYGNSVAMALLGERLARGFCCAADPARANSIRRIALGLGLPVPEPDAAHGFSAPEPVSKPALPAPFPVLDLSRSAAAAVGEMLDERIQLMVFAELLSAEECLYIQCLGGPLLQPSRSVGPDGKWHLNQIRTSHDFQFLPEHEELTLKLLQLRLANAAQLPLSNAEPLILLRYQPGQEYKPHRDYLPPSRYVALEAGGAGQRLRTVIAYLNAPETGGETAFPLLGQSIKPQRGHVLRFDNMDGDGRINEHSLHAGLPVKQGLKWICTLWIRQNALRMP
ncbi:MAG: 2OG-Fe(II) oxygenase [Arenimonas sp.]|nr:2OG-Fe(II) oxygenase [Arenimonas sp.]